MTRVNRKRNKAVTIRMTETEYSDLQKRTEEAGISQQSFVINAIRGAIITPSDEIAELRTISQTFSDMERQLRGLATNVNQMAHIANGQGAIPSATELERLGAQINTYRKESEGVWRSIRLLTSQQSRTAQCEMS